MAFTASMEIYGAAVADKLDNSRGILHKRYYRQVSILTLLTSPYGQIHQLFEHLIINIFLSISFNICFGCTKEPSH